MWALKQANAFFLNQNFGGMRSVLRYLVPVANVQIAHADKVVGEFGGHLVAGHVLNLEALQIEDIGHGDARQTVKLSRVLNELLAQPELVVAFDPGDARAGQTAAERAQDFPPGFNLALELRATARRQVVA